MGRKLVGVAQQRSRLTHEALASFRAALELDPENAYAERNLGAALGSAGSVEEAAQHFRRAILLNKDDQAAFLGLAQAVESLGRFDEANEIYSEVIRMGPQSRLAEVAKDARGAIASRDFRIESIGQPRPDATGIDPDMDVGFDLSKEYAAARGIYQARQR